MSESAELDDCWNRIGVWSHGQSSCPQLENVIHCRNCEHYSRAGREILRKPVPEQYRQEWSERLSHADQAPLPDLESVLLFRLGSEWLGLNSIYINEICQVRTLHRLPRQETSIVKGVVNIRGELKICVSLDSVLRVAPLENTSINQHGIHERMIYVSKGEQNFVFRVNEVFGVHRYQQSGLKTIPSTVSRSKQSFTTGILLWEQRKVGILDAELLFYSLEKGLR